MMTLQELMDGLARTLGCPGGIRPDDSGEVNLECDGLALSFRAISGGEELLMWSPLAERPAGDFSRWGEILLKANFCGALTGGASLSLSEDGTSVCLHRRLTLAGVSDKTFLSSFETFVETALTWQQLLADEDARPREDSLMALGFRQPALPRA